MSRESKTILAAVGAFLTLYFLVILAAGINQLAQAADRVHPTLGASVFWTLSVAFVVLLLVPVFLYFRFPPALVPPADEEGPQFELYLATLKERLACNPRLAGVPLNSRDDVEAGLRVLSSDAEKVVREAAAGVFISTALLQNGRLDGLSVLAIQLRMIWKIARIYFQRPSPRQLFYLYSNIGATALVAASIDDMDFAEMVKPLALSAIPAMKGAIPGLGSIVNLTVNSLSSGAANAFLTLRVGAIAKHYCESTSVPKRSLVRRSATSAAAAHIGRVIRDNGALVLRTIWDSLKDLAEESAQKISESSKSFGGAILERLSWSREADEPQEAFHPPPPPPPAPKRSKS